MGILEEFDLDLDLDLDHDDDDERLPVSSRIFFGLLLVPASFQIVLWPWSYESGSLTKRCFAAAGTETEKRNESYAVKHQHGGTSSGHTMRWRSPDARVLSSAFAYELR